MFLGRVSQLYSTRDGSYLKDLLVVVWRESRPLPRQTEHMPGTTWQQGQRVEAIGSGLALLDVLVNVRVYRR